MNAPFERGYRMPAEWEPHEATWIVWPHNASDWPGKFQPIPWVYAEIVRKIEPGETVRVLVNHKRHEEHARKVLRLAGADGGRIEFFDIATNRGWIRDSGPVFLRGPEEGDPMEAACFRFNAWAKYPDFGLDELVARTVCRRIGIPSREALCNGGPFVLEGGAVDVNGRGTVLTTEECLLDTEVQVRNPGLGRAETEAALRDYLGAANVLWFGKGIAGDDTHGHVDDLARFANPNTILLCREQNPKDENYAALEENWERIAGMRLEDGSKPEAIALPMPSPLYFDGQRLPASYANFYISNAAVLVPTFNDPNDRIALGILAECFPDRDVIGIHAVDLVWGLGTLHCLTREQPAPRPAAV